MNLQQSLHSCTSLQYHLWELKSHVMTTGQTSMHSTKPESEYVGDGPHPAEASERCCLCVAHHCRPLSTSLAEDAVGLMYHAEACT